MTERFRLNQAPKPTSEDIWQRALRSPRMFKLIESRGLLVTTEKPKTVLPSFKITTEIPGARADWITELHCLDLGCRARNGLLRVGITKVEELLTKPDQEILRIWELGPIALEKIHTGLDKFRQRIIAEAEQNPGQAVIIDISSEIIAAVKAGKTYKQIQKEFGLWPKTTRQIIKNEMPERLSLLPSRPKETRPWKTKVDPQIVADFVLDWRQKHPDKNGLGGQAAAVRHFNVSPQIVHRYLMSLRVPVYQSLSPEIRTQRQEKIIAFIKDRLSEKPQRRGVFSLTARQFGISRERVRQVVAAHKESTGESLKQKKAISLRQLAHGLGTTPGNVLELLRRGLISLGDPAIDAFFTAADYNPNLGNLKTVIPKSLLTPEDILALRVELATRLPSEEEIRKTMADLTLGVAKRNKDIYPSFLSLAKQAGIRSPKKIGAIFDELATAGFHLREFPVHDRTASYYVAHELEAGKIVTYLKQKIEAKK